MRKLTTTLAAFLAMPLLSVAAQDQPLQFIPERVDGTGIVGVLEGYVDSGSPAAFERFMADYPGVGLLIFYFVPGSADDDANIELANRIHELGLATYAPGDSFLASGGVDLFLAGVERTIECGAELGVHSWATGDGREGIEVPRNDPQHRLYLDYYRTIGIDDAFYWYTLEAAPADDLHIMSDAEIAEHGMATTKRRC